MSELSHFGSDGRPQMVDVGGKKVTNRTAIASGTVTMAPQTLEKLLAGTNKGDVIGVATLAGIIGAKKTSEIIPLCHPLPLTNVVVEVIPDSELPGVGITATAKTTGQTGVEMEALMAVMTAALTVYDMLKAVDRGMVIDSVQLEEKSGGASGHWKR